MKKILALISLLAILCTSVLTSCTNPPYTEPQTEALPENVTENGLKYQISLDKSYYDVIGISEDASGEIIIPAVCYGLPVKNIVEYAFLNNQKITSVIISDGVQSIQRQAFSGCSLLEHVEIPDSVQSIATGAFLDSRKLGAVSIDDEDSDIETINHYTLANEDEPDTISLDDILNIELDAFKNTEFFNDKSNWENGVLYLDKHLIAADPEEIPEIYSIKNGTKSIAHEAFAECVNLKEIHIPNSVKYIGCSAFWSTSITEISVPNGCVRIDSGAFSACSKLVSISIPDNVKSIGSSIVDETPFYENINNWENILDVEGRQRGQALYVGKHLLKATGGGGRVACVLNVKEGTKTIADMSVAYTGFSGVTIPSSVSRIPYWAFYYSEDITYIDLPSSIKEFDYESFRGCISLRNITIPNGIKVIPEAVFSECKSLSSIVIPASVKKISDCAFCECIKLTDVTFNNGLREIGSSAFDLCSSLQSITLPDTVERIGDGAFSQCPKLKELKFPRGVCEIGGSIVDHFSAYFNNDSNWDNALYVGNHLIFADKRVTGTCEIREGTTDIAKYAFSHTHTLEHIVIPDSVEYMNELAFANVGTLKSIIFENPQDWTVYTNQGQIKIKAEELEGNCITLLTGDYSKFVWVKN